MNMIDIDNLKCNYCNKNFSNRDCLRIHCNYTNKHKLNVIKLGIKEPNFKESKTTIYDKNRTERNKKVIIKDGVAIIPLYNNYYALVDDFIWDKINNYTISCSQRNGEGYLQIIIKDKTYMLHRYIYYKLYNRVARFGEYQVDHINRNTYDCTINNLREVNSSLNNRNRTKFGVTSIYRGVAKNHNRYICSLTTENDKFRFSYENETHAAYHYNLLLLESGLDEYIPLNDIEKPDDFVLKINKIRDLPKGIVKIKNKYAYNLNKKRYYNYNTIEDALTARTKHLEKIELERINKILNFPIERNEQGVPVIKIVNRKNNFIGIIKVDAHRYYELKLLGLYASPDYYVTVKVNDKYINLSRYLMCCTNKNKYVDHRNNDRYDYQMNNLRIISPLQNSQNKLSLKNSTSIYVGVSYTKSNNTNCWKASIYDEYLGCFKTEKEAAMVRDMKAYQLNMLGNMYKINLPEDLQFNLFIISMSEKYFNMDYLFYNL
jgi:hypothetical protein